MRSQGVKAFATFFLVFALYRLFDAVSNNELNMNTPLYQKMSRVMEQCTERYQQNPGLWNDALEQKAYADSLSREATLKNGLWHDVAALTEHTIEDLAAVVQYDSSNGAAARDSLANCKLDAVLQHAHPGDVIFTGGNFLEVIKVRGNGYNTVVSVNRYTVTQDWRVKANAFRFPQELDISNRDYRVRDLW
mgnify:CR=1 FL=1